MNSPVLELAPLYAPSPRPGLARIAYGTASADGLLAVPVRQLGAEPLVEIWPEWPGMVFGAVSLPDAGDLAATAREVYSSVIEQARAGGHPYFVRMWNYVGSINGFDGGCERYQLFCAGRHEAFVAAGWGDSALPAASAVGMPGRGLITCYLASDRPGVQVENPRQVSAWCYPRQYGPKSPSFARATMWQGTLLVSGTSSVVGHRTVHAGDVEAQLDETLRNIEAVIGAAMPGRGLRNVVAAKTYVRHAEDYPFIESRLASVFPNNLYLQADICRADLLLEIEVVAR